ncbi:MAG: helix-turn-helix transcriptional regulator [Acidimicrobiales bacterium]|nr:helix-turn-helix transcriptional regulator [Acidimicrobiales bacterium]
MTDALEQRWREVGEFIRDQRRLGQLSLRKLADQAGVSNPYLSQIERGLRRPSAEILQQIAKALEISAETLFVRAGILDERVGSEDDLVGAISRDPTLTDDQRQTLAHIYRSFQAANGLRPEPVPDAEADGPADSGGGIGESSGDS